MMRKQRLGDRVPHNHRDSGLLNSHRLLKGSEKLYDCTLRGPGTWASHTSSLYPSFLFHKVMLEYVDLGSPLLSGEILCFLRNYSWDTIISFSWKIRSKVRQQQKLNSSVSLKGKALFQITWSTISLGTAHVWSLVSIHTCAQVHSGRATLGKSSGKQTLRLWIHVGWVLVLGL